MEKSKLGLPLPEISQMRSGRMNCGRNYTRSPTISAMLSEGMTAANTTAAFGDHESIKIVYQTDSRVGEATDDHMLDHKSTISRNLNTNPSLHDTKSTNMSSIQGLSCHSRRSKVLVNLSTQNLLNNYHKKQKLSQIVSSSKLPAVVVGKDGSRKENHLLKRIDLASEISKYASSSTIQESTSQ